MQIEGWTLSSLGEIGKWSGGGTPSKAKKEFWENGNIPWVSPKDMWQKKISTTEDYITQSAVENSATKIYPKDSILVVTRSGILRKKLPVALAKIPVAVNQDIKVLTPNEKFSSEYLFNFMWCYNDSLLANCAKDGTTVESIDTTALLTYPINLPPLAEQKKIAEILSTWDKAIETVEKLVANSQQQKKALMQQLLTGQKRLLDDNGVRFSESWEEKSIKSILTISKGQQLNRDTLNTTSVYPVINGGIVPSGYTDEFNTKANTITISEGGNSCGYVSFQKTDFWCGGHCYALKKLKLNLEFTYHLLKFNEIQIMRLRVGSGLPNIQKKDLENLMVSFPTNSHEQEKIAQVLTLADREIDLYQQQLDKLKLEKKALMQQLLTGQRRVKI